MSKSTNVSVSMSPQCARAWCRLERLFEAFFLHFLPFISVWGAPHTCLESWDSIDDRIYARLRAARMRNAVARQHQPIRQITVIVANVHVPPTAVA